MRGPGPSLKAEPPEETLDELYAHAPVGYLTMRTDGTIARANATLADWLGRHPGDVVGRPLLAILAPEALRLHEAQWAPALAAGAALRQVAVDFACADGRRFPALVDSRPLADAEGRLLGHRVMVVDATDRRAYERDLLAERERARAAAEELARLNAELEARVEERTAELAQLQKIESLGSLTGGVAHDFNNLLTPIVACLDILQRRAGLDDRSARLVQGAAEAAERARMLVSRLLTFARRQSLEAQDVDLAALVGGMRDLVGRSLGPMIPLEVAAEPGLPPARVDPNQLELALLNLCVNARDAMGGEGRLAIRLSRRRVGPGDPSRLAPGLYLRLEVSDTGAGMDAETLRRAREPFFSTKEPGKGTGLGLSMVDGLARQSGGALVIDSAQGRGTTVAVLLPAALAAATSRERVAEALPMPAARPLRVLLVDDEDLVRSAVAQMLREMGHEVREAALGVRAFGLLQEERFDLMIADHAMPGMTGAALAAAARAVRPDLAILLVTGYAEQPRALADGFPWLSKPFGQARLALAIAEAMRPGEAPQARAI